MRSCGDVAKCCALVLAALVGGVGCDLIVQPGETLTLGDGGSVLGSGGTLETAPLPAVRVRPGGAVVVENAKLFGGGIVIEKVEQPQFGQDGAGIRSDEGSVRVLAGEVKGGPVLMNVNVVGFDVPGSGIRAVGSKVEIEGGTFTAGALIANFPGATQPTLSLPPHAVDVEGGTLLISGGVFSAGALRLASQPEAPSMNPSILATRARVDIQGGEFNGGMVFVDSTARIFGGNSSILVFTSGSASGCSEIHGGIITGVGVVRGRLLVFGTGLTLTPFAGEQLLTGKLEFLDATTQTAVVLREGGQIVLAEPGSPGCPGVVPLRQ